MDLEDDKLLLAEYAHFTDSFLKNEELGEHRVEFFISVTTAVIGGVVVLMFSKDQAHLDSSVKNQIATAALLSALLFGVVTFIRILHRDRVTDKYKEILGYLRGQLRQRSPGLVDYHLTFGDKGRWFSRGGLGVTTALINSVLVACIAAVWASCWASAWTWAGGLAAFLIAFAIQGAELAKRDREHD